MKPFEKIRYVLILATFRLLTLLPLKLLFLISELITFIVYTIIGYRKKVVLENIKNSFPNYSDEQVRFIARKYYRHLSVMMVENIYLRFVSEKEFKQKLVIDDLEIFQKYLQQKKSIIVMLGHFGNWEYGAGLTKFLPYKGYAVYKQLSDKVFDVIYYDIRSRIGVEPIEMKDVFRKVYQISQSADPSILFMVADQAPSNSESQNWLHFLHQDTCVFSGSEKLAKKFDMPVIYMKLMRIKKGSYKIISSLITETPKETKPMEITEKYYQLLEESIVDAPRFWLWSHRRWKYRRSVQSE
jgi:KDO2-lipid IV(A) lauroyltransferase